MTTAAVVLFAACALAFGEAPRATMTKFMVKREGPDVPKDSFAAQPRMIYRAGSQHCRVEENPDLQHGLWIVLIINEPDIWVVNRLTKTARHTTDAGPTYNCRLLMFGNAEDIKSAEDLKKPLMELEFGREIEYFRSRSGPPTPGPDWQGKATMVYATRAGEAQLFLFTAGDPEAPVAVFRKNDETGKTIVRDFIYGEYAQVPFDPKLFAKPEGVKIEEAQPPPAPPR